MEHVFGDAQRIKIGLGWTQAEPMWMKTCTETNQCFQGGNGHRTTKRETTMGLLWLWGSPGQSTAARDGKPQDWEPLSNLQDHRIIEAGKDFWDRPAQAVTQHHLVTQPVVLRPHPVCPAGTVTPPHQPSPDKCHRTHPGSENQS